MFDQCINTSWFYYKIDNCEIPALLLNGVSASKSAEEAAAAGTKSPGSELPSSTAGESGNRVDLTAGAVTGIAVSCVAGTAAVLGAVWFVVRWRNEAQQAAAAWLQEERAESMLTLPDTCRSISPEMYDMSEEVSGPVVVEAPDDMHFPVTELSGLSRPGELPGHRY